jgi:hypothetical protein
MFYPPPPPSPPGRLCHPRRRRQEQRHADHRDRPGEGGAAALVFACFPHVLVVPSCSGGLIIASTSPTQISLLAPPVSVVISISHPPSRQVVRPVLGISFAPDQSTEQLGVKGERGLDTHQPKVQNRSTQPSRPSLLNSHPSKNHRKQNKTTNLTPHSSRHPRPLGARRRPRVAGRHPRHEPRRLRQISTRRHHHAHRRVPHPQQQRPLPRPGQGGGEPGGVLRGLVLCIGAKAL